MEVVVRARLMFVWIPGFGNAVRHASCAFGLSFDHGSMFGACFLSFPFSDRLDLAQPGDWFSLFWVFVLFSVEAKRSISRGNMEKTWGETSRKTC